MDQSAAPKNLSSFPLSMCCTKYEAGIGCNGVYKTKRLSDQVGGRLMQRRGVGVIYKRTEHKLYIESLQLTNYS